MQRFFNTTGPCEARKHYMLPASQRLPNVKALVERENYFVLHAARQVGKTTAMRAFAADLRAAGYVAVHATLETSQGATDVAEAEPRWLWSVFGDAKAVLPAGDVPPEPHSVDGVAVGQRFGTWLSAWSEAVAPRHVVLLLDEADTVTGPAVVNLLRQLRGGFNRRPGRFPVSIALIGMRDLRDYITEAKDGVQVNPGSPFNIKASSITMRNFNAAEVVELLAQHTAETGQVFLPEASERIFWWTNGQPYLVNALALICMDDLCPDRSVAVTAEHIDIAKEQLILARTTHLDSLAERLKEPRVAPIIEAMLLGDAQLDYSSDHFRYVTDLGLVVRGRAGAEAANPLYREVLAREVSYNRQMNMPAPLWRWQRPDGGLDFPLLVREFQKYWRANADIVVEHLPQYPEAVTHITYMAFLQRVVNGGGHITREFAAGRGATDIVVGFAGEQFATEIKRVRPRDSFETIRSDGLTQLGRYLDTLGLTEGWLLIVDQRPNRTWEERIWAEDVTVDGKLFHIVGA